MHGFKKVFGKVEDVQEEGRTVLLVSHNMATISSLCNTALLLDQGRVIARGKTSDIVLAYYSQGIASPASFDYSSSGKLTGDDHASLLAGSIVGKHDKPSSEIDIREPIRIIMKYKIMGPSKNNCIPNFHIFSSDHMSLFQVHRPLLYIEQHL
jgi:lipopolysaccharide transport system ATP-binding protein